MNKLIIAQFQKEQGEVNQTLCRIADRIDTGLLNAAYNTSYGDVNQTTRVFTFISKDNAVVPNFKRFYPGITMLGKYFLVRNMSGFRVARHYTICNSMRPEVYAELVRMLRQGISDVANSDEDGSALANLLRTEDENQICMCIKNYNSWAGLSLKFFDNQHEDFEVKGPMGKSLGIETTGTYLAFAGGTGILPFMDFIAQLAIANLGLNDLLSQKQSESIDAKKFKLRMFISFHSRHESIGLELMTALEQYSKAKGLNNFELYQRFSKEKVNPSRWNADFIEREISKDPVKEIRKIFVCGPPEMNETFDRALT